MYRIFVRPSGLVDGATIMLIKVLVLCSTSGDLKLYKKRPKYEKKSIFLLGFFLRLSIPGENWIVILVT